jgi:transcriptional regulator with XRE-family HTH domain
MNDRQVFGAFLKEKRNERTITLRAMAEMIGVGYGYYSDLESGRRTPIELEFLDKIISALRLLDEDSRKLYDFAGKAREAAPPDLTGYINDTPKARIALRVAKETATDDDWERFTQYLEQKEKGDL